MTDRELQIARAAIDAAANVCNHQHHRMDLPADYRYAAGMCEYYIREIDLPSIVAGVKGEDVSDSLDWNRLRTGDIRALNPAHQDVFDEVASLRARVAELERDADRLAALVWPECVLDGIGAIDIHEEAVIYASAFGREEPNKDDYLAALRTAIDAAMMEKE